MTIFYGIIFPPFESDDYVELDIHSSTEEELEKLGCRIIEIGEQPFTQQALAVKESMQEGESDEFTEVNLLLNSSYDESLAKAYKFLKVKPNVKPSFYLC